MTKEERLTLGLQGQLYRLTIIKLDKINIQSFNYDTVTKFTTKQKWSKKQIHRMVRLFQHINNGKLTTRYKYEVDPVELDFWWDRIDLCG